MYDVNYGRALMGDSLGFHIVFVLLTIGFPFVMSLIEYFAWRRNNQSLYKMVKLLSDWTTVLVVTGVISGTLIAMQFSILWGPFVAEARPFVGKYFMLEGYAFMIEAVFLVWYRLTAGKMSPGRHWLIGLPISLGAIGSAFTITTVNAWMNNPTAVFTSTTFFEVSHSVTSYLLASIMVVIAWLAWRIWRSGTTLQFPHWLIYKLSLVALGLLIVISVLGHMSAQNLAKTQPLKLAGLEILDKTQTNAPLRIGGHINQQTKVAQGGVIIPGGLSFLAGNSTDTQVKGLDQAPKEHWPMLVIHMLFDIKMALVGGVSAVILATLVVYRRSRSHKFPQWFAKLLVLAGSFGVILVELGWMLTELGRQPWAIQGKLLTKDAFTSNNSALSIGYIFPLMFVFLLLASVFALRIVTKTWRRTEKITW